ncbi:MAG: hypothetical protein NTZ37_04135 [Methanoregula sp.]|nr:hypothetical protein [Methanoregula sp.]
MVVSKFEDTRQGHKMGQIERCCVRTGSVYASGLWGVRPLVPSCALAFTVLFLAGPLRSMRA